MLKIHGSTNEILVLYLKIINYILIVSQQKKIINDVKNKTFFKTSFTPAQNNRKKKNRNKHLIL